MIQKVCNIYASKISVKLIGTKFWLYFTRACLGISFRCLKSSKKGVLKCQRTSRILFLTKSLSKNNLHALKREALKLFLTEKLWNATFQCQLIASSLIFPYVEVNIFYFVLFCFFFFQKKVKSIHTQLQFLTRMAYINCTNVDGSMILKLLLLH